MHRAYQPIQPSHNKLLQKRWDNTYYDEHRNRLRSAKSVVDTKAPQTYVHMHLKLKKLQLEEERMSTIERDNRLLLEKMSQIIRTRGRVDNRNHYQYRSLNHEKRQRELLRVTKENQKILGRITVREPEYSHARLEKDWRDQEKLMDNIARYPKNWWKQVENQRKRKQKSRGQSGASTARSMDSSRQETPRTISEMSSRKQTPSDDHREKSTTPNSEKTMTPRNSGRLSTSRSLKEVEEEDEEDIREEDSKDDTASEVDIKPLDNTTTSTKSSPREDVV